MIFTYYVKLKMGAARRERALRARKPRLPAAGIFTYYVKNPRPIMDITRRPHMQPMIATAEGLAWVAEKLVRAAARQIPREPVRRNTTLRPGAATPMWNALVLAVRPHLRRRGEKTNLGRELGVPPQRIHEYFVGRTATPDAERLLLILRWLAVRQSATAPAPPK